MTPSYAIKGGVRYRYYVSSVLAQGRKEEAGAVSRIGSDAIESIVLDALATLLSSKKGQEQRRRPSQTRVAAPQQPEATSDKDRVEFIDRIIISGESVEIRLLDSVDITDQSSVLAIPWSPASFLRKREVIQPTGAAGDARPIRAKARTKLLASIAMARRWLEQLLSGEAVDIEAIAAREGLTERSMRMTLSLAFLAPDVVKAASTASLPRGFGVSRLTDLPAAARIWRIQTD
jgi:site-specific DNA recombinase